MDLRDEHGDQQGGSHRSDRRPDADSGDFFGRERHLSRLGQRPTRIYRDPVDKEVLWTMNEGDPVTGLDTISGCLNGGSVSVLHNSHILAGGAKPHITKTVCLSGTGEHFMASLQADGSRSRPA